MMDAIIADLCNNDEVSDLVLCYDHGIAYQKDMKVTAVYDKSYFNKCAGYEGTEIANKINAGRHCFVNDYIELHQRVLDIGVGSGEFIRNRTHTFGYDINMAAVEWLKGERLFSDRFYTFKAFTFWDVIEHIPDPAFYFKHIRPGSFVFVSIPIIDYLDKIWGWKHYRPGEHLYYFTRDGFVEWMGRYGFVLLEQRDYETRAGREDILSFVFVRSCRA